MKKRDRMLKPFATLTKHTEAVLDAQMLINRASLIMMILLKNIVPMYLPSVSVPMM